ncbi:tetratricopeptide repeat protein [Streptomyces sp. NPDC102476]|uniref:tetratricopeptide repeat protein n=1 Tax=Streptomyces sp. NPDC102476 TaxID=3366181 RepID=UPI00380C3006
MEYHAAPRSAVVWPVRVGTVPTLASAFQPRPNLQKVIEQARAKDTAATLTQVLSGGGGVGKSQLAAACAHQALAAGTELVVWVNAAETEQVVTGYAAAAHRVQAPGTAGGDAEIDARAFLDWLAVSSRSWLVVLDDLTDLEGIGPWWPPPSPGGDGRVLATTRRREALLTGGRRAVIDIGAYTSAEAVTYLSERFTDTDVPHLLDQQAEALAEALGRLPLALGHAAAYMINEDMPCASYLQSFTDRQSRLDALLPPGADTEGYGRQVTATLLLALDVVQRCDPVGLAAPVIRLAALLDAAGHPQSLWADAAVTDYLTAHHTPPPSSSATPQPTDVTAQQARAALRLLHRYGLLTCDSRNGPRAVRLHALTARAAREATPAPQAPAAVKAAADALAAIWPEADHAEPDLCTVLRANTDTLASHGADLLWRPDGHPVLYRAGVSLIATGLYAAAVTHWHHLVINAERLLGDEHPDTLNARINLASSYRQVGRTSEAIALAELVLADCERLLDDEHPGTSTARGNLASSYWQAGRTSEAITLLERVVADYGRLLGDEHPSTLTARGNLASSYWHAGRTSEALTLELHVLADCERLLGDEHPNTLAARANLAYSYRQAGRTSEAITLLEQVVADSERLLGDEHPNTLAARANLALSYRQAGRTSEAITLLEQVVADRERLLGDEHPNTLAARGNLALSYRRAGHTSEAITLEERVLADRERLLGDEHPDTPGARANLAYSYSQAGRTSEAITLLEQVVADSERLLGDEHPNTLAARTNLAACYWQAGRTSEAITLEERVLADRERLLGDEHPDTLAARTNLAASYWQVERTSEAITLLERVVADSERLLGDEHSNTLAARANLAASYRCSGQSPNTTASTELGGDSHGSS